MTPSKFQNTVYDYYERHGRMLPWRLKSVTPYHILISEFMLQQTQVDRVIDTYSRFIKKYPTIDNLAKTSVQELYSSWKGLGYNRRAIALRKTAITIVKKYKGKIPKDVDSLQELPGIGPYTAAAILVFAFNKPTILIETNIRSVYIFHFFKNRKKICDEEIIPLLKKTLDQKNSRLWYSALMDYGTMIKKEHGNVARYSAHYIRQTPFKGSRREVRGGILKLLDLKKNSTKEKLAKELHNSQNNISSVLKDLEKEGFIFKSGGEIFNYLRQK